MAQGSAHDQAKQAPRGPGPRVVRVSEKNPKVRTVALEPAPLGPDRAFLPAIITGIGVTARHFFKNVIGRRETETIEYPEERPPYPPRHRGVHRLMHREDGSVRCVACMLCPTICPAHCIHVEAAEAPWDDREKYPAKFDIDELRCIYCGMCEEVCPVDAIELTPTYDLVGQSRQDMIFDKQKLLAVYDATISDKPM